MFDWSFVSGRHAFWQFPKGTIGGSYGAVRYGASARRLFQLRTEPWHLPLFYVSGLGTPTGTNVTFLDVVPIVALIGKLIHSLTGAMVNPYGVYLFLLFVLPGVMMTLVLIAAKIRYVLATILADSMPALLWRWAHIAAHRPD